MESNTPTHSFACPRCTVGRCTLQTTTIADVYHGLLLCIPNIPAYICDVCRFVEFTKAVQDLPWQELYDEQQEEVSAPPAPERGTPYGGGSG